jgi:hypothetical protein
MTAETLLVLFPSESPVLRPLLGTQWVPSTHLSSIDMASGSVPLCRAGSSPQASLEWSPGEAGLIKFKQKKFYGWKNLFCKGLGSPATGHTRRTHMASRAGPFCRLCDGS